MVYQGLHPKSSGLSSFIIIFLPGVAILGAYPIFRHKGNEAICIRRIENALFKTSEIAATVYPNNGYLVRRCKENDDKLLDLGVLYFQTNPLASAPSDICCQGANNSSGTRAFWLSVFECSENNVSNASKKPRHDGGSFQEPQQSHVRNHPSMVLDDFNPHFEPPYLIALIDVITGRSFFGQSVFASSRNGDARARTTFHLSQGCLPS